MSSRVDKQRGMVTAEIAMALPALVLVTVLAIWGVTAVSVQLACTDAARSGARAAARGESMIAVRALVIRSVPDGASVRVHRDANHARVEIAVPVEAPTGVHLPSFTVRGHATAITEPGADHEHPPPRPEEPAPTAQEAPG